MEETTLHMVALRRLVELRGGLQRLGWSGTLGMFITWYVPTTEWTRAETNTMRKGKT